jgi:ribosome biogenesis GTPase
VDIKPGDRASLCVKPMEPIALWVSDGGEWRVIHRCSGCGVLKPNRLAGDDSETVIAELVGRLTER